MLAVIKTGGKQYSVKAGTLIKVEKLTAEKGSEVTFDDVLMYGTGDGKLEFETKKCVVKGIILEQKRDKKVIAFKKKRRKDYKKTIGHKQKVTVVKISSITA